MFQETDGVYLTETCGLKSIRKILCFNSFGSQIAIEKVKSEVWTKSFYWRGKPLSSHLGLIEAFTEKMIKYLDAACFRPPDSVL